VGPNLEEAGTAALNRARAFAQAAGSSGSSAMLYRLCHPKLLTVLKRLAILAFRGNAMGHWFHHTVVETGHVPLFCLFVAFVGSFGGIRVAVRLLRANDRRRPADTKPGGLHIHHMVYGVVLMVGAGVAGYAVPDRMVAAESATAAAFGVGSALVLDEFALILHFQDVYWSDVGRTSIHAVFVALAVTAALLFGLRPDLATEQALRHGLTGGWSPLVVLAASVLLLITLAFVLITLLKGKIWMGLLALFVPVLSVVAVVGAVRLARPHSPWARWRYHGGQRARQKMTLAQRRERRYQQQPLGRLATRLQNLVAGRPDKPSPGD
jgi:hypothetical protein